VVIAMLGAVAALLLPSLQAARESSRRVACADNLKRLGAALLAHHDARGALPRNRHPVGPGRWQATSATVQLLPFFEEAALHQRFVTAAGPPGDWEATYRLMRSSPLRVLRCASAPAAISMAWSGAGGNYAWCTGSSLDTNWGGERFNGMIAYDRERRLADVADGLSHTILAGEILAGTGTTGAKGVFPFDVFYAGGGVFRQVSNRSAPSAADLEAIGRAAVERPQGVRGNNGGLWAWYAAGHSSFTTAAPPNWMYPSAGGDCCPGGAHDWADGVIPPRSMHPGGVHVLMGDAAVRWIADAVAPRAFQQLGNRHDGGGARSD